MAGVLVEAAWEGERLTWAIAGIGVDVRRPPRPHAGAAYLDDVTPAPAPLAAVAAAVLDGVGEAYSELLATGFGPLRDEYVARMAWTGRDVELRDLGGRRVAAGRLVGVDGMGRLELDSADGPLAVSSGEVSLRPRGPAAR